MARTATARRPRMTPEEARAYGAEQRQKLEALTDAAYVVLHTGPAWREVLSVAAALPTRGPINIIAITAQMPAARDVRSKRDWRKDGRHPARGSQALRIWTPVTGRPKDETDPGTAEQGQEGQQEDATPGRVRAYKAGCVWDVSQTDGDDYTPSNAPALDPAEIAAHLAAKLPGAEPTADAPALLQQLAERLFTGPEMAPGQNQAQAESAAHLAARMIGLTPGPAPAPQLGGIFTGDKGIPAIRDAAVNVIHTGRTLAATATGTTSTDHH